ncbi:MAG: hypothetical protein ACKPCP_17450 [Sphaerospermopsis kisseleviana]
MKKRDPTYQLPQVPESSLDDMELTEYELEAIKAERQKSHYYRLALLELSMDLPGLLLVAKDKKMQSLFNQFIDGSLVTSAALFMGAGLLGIALTPAVIGVGFVGGGLINCFSRD